MSGKAGFPDGKPILDQPVLLARAWSIIGATNRYWEKATRSQ